jgi:hypothetical protein
MGNQLSTCLGIRTYTENLQPSGFATMSSKKSKMPSRKNVHSCQQSPGIETEVDNGADLVAGTQNQPSEIAEENDRPSVPVYLSVPVESEKIDQEAIGCAETIEPEPCVQKSYLSKPAADSQVEEIDLIINEGKPHDHDKESSDGRTRVVHECSADQRHARETAGTQPGNPQDDSVDQDRRHRASQEEEAEPARSGSNSERSSSASAAATTVAADAPGEQPGHLLTPPASPGIQFTPHPKQDDACSVASSSTSADEEAARLLGSRRLRSVMAILQVPTLLLRAPPPPVESNIESTSCSC